MDSWWVGKDRESFNVAVQEHADRIMRSGTRVPRQPPVRARVEPDLPPVAPPPPAPPEPTPVAPPAPATTRICERCGVEFIPKVGAAGRFCTRACYENEPPRAKPSWKPGSRGRAPKWARRYLEIARVFMDGVNDSDEAQKDPALGRAIVIMAVGFFFAQREDWVVAFTDYTASEVKRVAKNLRTNGVWLKDERMACKWLEPFVTKKRLSKQQLFEFDLSLWLDGLVAHGVITRETRDGEFYYMATPELRSALAER